jgi:hypothetical protein
MSRFFCETWDSRLSNFQDPIHQPPPWKSGASAPRKAPKPESGFSPRAPRPQKSPWHPLPTQCKKDPDYEGVMAKRSHDPFLFKAPK